MEQITISVMLNSIIIVPQKRIDVPFRSTRLDLLPKKRPSCPPASNDVFKRKMSACLCACVCVCVCVGEGGWGL